MAVFYYCSSWESCMQEGDRNKQELGRPTSSSVVCPIHTLPEETVAIKLFMRTPRLPMEFDYRRRKSRRTLKERRRDVWIGEGKMAISMFRKYQRHPLKLKFYIGYNTKTKHPTFRRLPKGNISRNIWKDQFTVVNELVEMEAIFFIRKSQKRRGWGGESELMVMGGSREVEGGAQTLGGGSFNSHGDGIPTPTWKADFCAAADENYG